MCELFAGDLDSLLAASLLQCPVQYELAKDLVAAVFAQRRLDRLELNRVAVEDRNRMCARRIELIGIGAGRACAAPLGGSEQEQEDRGFDGAVHAPFEPMERFRSTGRAEDA